MRNVVIIGSGPAGLTAAIYAARANLNPLVLTGLDAGGQLMITSDVENYPGFRDPVAGPALMEEMTEQARRVGAELLSVDCDSIDLSHRPFHLTAGDQEWDASTVIVATGASARWLGLPSETALRNHGVSACATCDGFFFRGKDVIVVGGGDTALEEALFLTRMVHSVKLVHRRDALRGSKVMQDRAFKNEKIEILWNSVIDEIHDPAQNMVTGVRIRNTRTDEKSELPIDGVFIATGHQPNTAFLKGQLQTNELGYLVLNKGQMTSVPGVFAAGDVHDHTYRQAVTAAGAGCAAAIEVERFLEAG